MRSIANKQIAVREIPNGEYETACDCCETFRNSPEGVAPRAKYDNQLCGLVLEQILRDGMNVECTLKSLRRDRPLYCVLDVIELHDQSSFAKRFPRLIQPCVEDVPPRMSPTPHRDAPRQPARVDYRLLGGH